MTILAADVLAGSKTTIGGALIYLLLWPELKKRWIIVAVAQ